MKAFMSIPETCKETGFSTYFLRNGVKSGTIPHISVGSKCLINVPAMLEMLDSESRASVLTE